MRYLVVGLGNIGRRRRDVLGPKCVATADPFNAEAEYRDPRECPADRYDAVVLAVPNDVKLSLASWFVEAGKHVLVEKPMLFANRAEVDALEAACVRSDAVWYTSYNHRFEPVIELFGREMSAGWLGEIHHARLFYGNGTVRHVAEGWRSGGLGVVEDLGSHLLDLAGLHLGCRGVRFAPRTLLLREAPTYDLAVLVSADGRFELAMTFLSWANTFTVDVLAERGSVHVRGLNKWGGAELVARERVFPSGVPRERVEKTSGADVTWARDIAHFESVVASRELPTSNDWWISDVMNAIPRP